MTTITSFIIAMLIIFLVVVATAGGIPDGYDAITTSETSGEKYVP
jgi:hypothetical protein